jgi:signal transduction histidine kinase
MRESESITGISKELEMLRQEKEKLIGLISHDLRSPYNRLHALLQLMQMNDANLNADQKMYLEKMHIVVADALSMMRNLMDYRSLELNLLELRPELMDAGELVQQVVKNFSAVAIRKGITIDLHNIRDAMVIADRYCLQRAVENILSNAIKFSFPGKKVVIRIHRGEESIDIEVSDEGQGIKHEELPRLGEKFIKLSPRPTAGESATGLGLYITRSLLQQNHGSLTWKSLEGRGSIFTIRLPAVS